VNVDLLDGHGGVVLHQLVMKRPTQDVGQTSWVHHTETMQVCVPDEDSAEVLEADLL
jgi:hypothetical protein